MVRVREQASGRHVAFPHGIVLYRSLLLLLTALPLLYILELCWVGDSPLLARVWSPEAERFGDFWHYRVLLQWLHRPEFFAARDRFAYPAPCAILYQWLYSFGSHPHASFNVMLWAAEAASAGLLLRALLRRRAQPLQATLLVALMAISSYPWHMLYDRGNIELFVYLFVGLGVWAWLTGHKTLAAILWGCAGALKIYPLLLLGIFAKRGNWRNFALGMTSAIGILLLSFWYVGPSITLAANGTMWGIRGFVGSYGAHSRYGELVYDHSLLAGIKEILAIPVFHVGDRQIILSHAYEAVVAVLGPVAFVRWRRSAPEKNQLCLLLLGMVALPPVSYDYTLIHVYLVIGIVLCDYMVAAAEGQLFSGWRPYFVFFAILCPAENWINVLGFEPNGLIKAASLVGVAVMLVRHPLRLCETAVNYNIQPQRTEVLQAS